MTENARPADEYLAVARVVAAHGIRGEVRCDVITDFPERFKRTRRLFAGNAHHAVEVERSRVERRVLLLKLAGVDTRDDAEKLRGQTLYVHESDAVQLPPDSFYWHQIIGLTVRTVDGQDLGQVAEIMETGSNDVYVVRSADREVLLPAIKDVIRNIDLAAGVITVELMEGLIE
jgi:16S rRNA processing protein RimM